MKKIFLPLATVLVAGACSTANVETPSPTPSPTAEPSNPSGELPPIELGSDVTSARVSKGELVVFTVEAPGTWTISADRPELVELYPGGAVNGSEFYPGVKLLEGGTVVVTLTSTTGEVRTWSIDILD